MGLVEMKAGAEDWNNVAEVSYILSKVCKISNKDVLASELGKHLDDPALEVWLLRTMENTHHRGVIVRNKDSITIAFRATGPNEGRKNEWWMTKGPGSSDKPYKRVLEGC